ncbi:MAG: hypothetical protein V8Q57_02215 [Blautia sp.]
MKGITVIIKNFFSGKPPGDIGAHPSAWIGSVHEKKTREENLVLLLLLLLVCIGAGVFWEAGRLLKQEKEQTQENDFSGELLTRFGNLWEVRHRRSVSFVGQRYPGPGR